MKEALRSTISREFKDYCHSTASVLKYTAPSELPSWSLKFTKTSLLFSFVTKTIFVSWSEIQGIDWQANVSRNQLLIKLVWQKLLFMGQSKFSVAGATGNSNVSVTVESAVPFFPTSPQSLLVYFSSLQSRRAVRFRLASPLDRISRKGLLAV